MDKELVAGARAAAAAGAAQVRRSWDQRLQVEHKTHFDFVTQADLRSQEAVLAEIERRFPGAAVLAEEEAGDYSWAARSPGLLWVVDPLDGTTNFIHHFPQVSVSVAAQIDGVLTAGAVQDVTREEAFWAERGQGAYLDGRRLAVSVTSRPDQALLVTGFPFRDAERGMLGRYLKLFQEIFLRVSGVRRPGSACLDLAWLAAGRADGFWEMGLKPWDLAAGILLVQEAGGLVTDYDGGEQALWRGDIVAGNSHIQPLIREICGRHFPGGV